MKKLLVLALLFASPALAQDQAAAARAAAGCGPADTQFDVKVDADHHPAGTPEEGKALVYVFEDWMMGPTMRVGLDGSWVGATYNKSYFFFSVTPGEHNLCAEWQSGTFKKTAERIGAARAIAFEAGKVYFVRMVFWEAQSTWGQINLELADKAEGQFLIASAGLSNFTQKTKK
jgi:hypothetical protein